MTNQQIKEVALAAGFKLKQQPDGSQDLNPYVYEFARKLIAEDFKRGQQVFKDLQRVEKERNQLRKERDQLEAKVVEFADFTRFVRKCVSRNGEYAPLTGMEMHELLSDEPSKCLAKRDARMKAEAVEEMGLMYAPGSAEREGHDRMAKAYRNLARGES